MNDTSDLKNGWPCYEEYIAARLKWVGWIQRKHLENRFALSTQRVSELLNKYININGGMIYNKHTKRYETTTTETTQITLAKAWSLGVLDDINPTQIETLTVREPKPELCQKVFQTLQQNGTIEISYQGQKQVEPETRKINPTQLVWDGERWHIRSYCHMAKAYRNFLLSRILTVTKTTKIVAPKDTDWKQKEEIKFKINETMEQGLKKAIKLEYQFEKENKIIQVKKANAFIARTKLGLLPKHKPFSEVLTDFQNDPIG